MTRTATIFTTASTTTVSKMTTSPPPSKLTVSGDDHRYHIVLSTGIAVSLIQCAVDFAAALVILILCVKVRRLNKFVRASQVANQTKDITFSEVDLTCK